MTTIDGCWHVRLIVTASRSGRLIAVRHYRTDERILLLDPQRRAPEWGRHPTEGAMIARIPSHVADPPADCDFNQARPRPAAHQVPHEHAGSRSCRAGLHPCSRRSSSFPDAAPACRPQSDPATRSLALAVIRRGISARRITPLPPRGEESADIEMTADGHRSRGRPVQCVRGQHARPRLS